MSVEELPAEAYARAERLLLHNRPRLALRAKIKPRWIGDTDTFWYRVETARGGEFVLVDVAARTRVPAFDHERLAAALAAASTQPVEPYALPLREIEFVDDAVAFDAFGAHWMYRPDTDTCTQDQQHRSPSPLEVASPDKKWVAFRRAHDVWVRSVETGAEFALTTDGTADRSYAANPDAASNRVVLGKLGLSEAPPVLVWSPDSTRILTHRVDQSELAWMPLVEAGPSDGSRPRLHAYRYAIPGENLPRGEWFVLDIAERTATAADAEPFLLALYSPIVLGKAWWARDGRTAYYLDQPRDLRTLRLHALDATTGAVRTVLEEHGDTRVEATQEIAHRPIVHVLTGGREVLWYSQRDGWGHLYRYEDGELVEQLTKGSFAVQDIAHVDESERVAYLVVSGLVADDPYRRSLVRVDLDGGALTRLTGDDLDHVITTPEHGRWFVDSESIVDTPPVTTVRGQDGAVLVELERADIGPLLAAGWTPPERIRTLAADGVTPVFGLLYKPYGFDETQRYPVLDHPYPGPQKHRVEPCFTQDFYGIRAEAAAGLGFAVLAIDGRGTPGRDKAFHDYSYRNLGSAGALDDHVAALRQLAETRPWLDLDRVGIFGVSGGGFTTVRAMGLYPEFYKVGVAEAGNHDNRCYHALWAETYDGPPDPEIYERTANIGLADRIDGKLLLIHGELDDNVTPHLTMRLVDALIEANRDFDLLIVPGVEHSFLGRENYVTRRRWDHLVRHLMGRRPPAGYRLADVPITPELLEALGG
ncbi:S9 family peptidase [Nocardia panacis]|uniref:S9 family peptidase n=1 Tax=Nocardia panacis TaxID=2340916 RepID=A0A3A4KFN9_9NOCA|nr:DPP IV N-terminal domain-containing protein [Nocardia panacis]RJO71448.1 S9 family peptidase [Nocardia panacis]